MLHDGSAVVDGFTLETPRPPSSHPPSLFTPTMTSANHANHAKPPSVVEWDWSLEHSDRKREAKADSTVHGAQPFPIDRNLLRDVIREKLDCRVGRITFLSSGAYPPPPPCSFFPLPRAICNSRRALGNPTLGTFHKVRFIFHSPLIKSAYRIHRLTPSH